MIAFAVLSLSILYCGYPITRVLWRRLDGEDALGNTTPLELASVSALFGAALWLAVNWALALTHTLTRPPLLVAAAAFVLFAAVDAFRNLRVKRSSLLLIPIALWVVYVLWRGSVLPPDSHDVLAYHLPRAVFIAQTHGYGTFWTGDPRISDLPANYEILLADVLILARSDRLTEWIGTLSFVLFLMAGGAVAERWWGRGRHVAAAVIALAATPVLLLHSGADKNDLMTGWLALVALLAGARWFARGGAMPWLTLIVALGVGGGTKPHQAAIMLGLMPFLIARMVRLLRQRLIGAREIAFTLAAAIIVFVLDGGATYILNVVRQRGAPLTMHVGAMQPGASTIIQYGDWSNLWQFPYLLLTAPFGTDDTAVWVPWRHERWFWPRYELFFSNFGWLITVLVVALPLCIWRYRRQADDLTRRERMAFTAASAIAFFVILPVQFRPIGLFGGFPRYLAFVLPAIVAWTVAPAMRELFGRVDLQRAARFAFAALVVVFGFSAIDIAANDRFSPFEYAMFAAEHPGTRFIWFNSLRAGVMLDRMAGPRDTVAVDAGFDTWIYPAMGTGRRLVFLRSDNGTIAIPNAAQWVMIDRSWSKLWLHPQFRDMGDFWQYASRGSPSEADTRVLRALRNDPTRWELVFYNPRLNQAIFHRR
jgi:hypothetical protein